MMYALHDNNPELKKKGAFPITFEEANDLNKQQYGIHHTPNTFKGIRNKENIERINYWIADLDEGTKEEQMAIIKSIIFKPSCIVETKRGYHCYWKAKDATVNNYNMIEKGIIEKLNADKGCKDVARLLRYPNYNHWKDPNDPFLIKVIEASEEQYTEKEMLYCFVVHEKYQRKPYNVQRDKKGFKDPENWDKIFGLNHITNGNRNNEFTRIIFWLKDEGFSKEEIEEMIYAMNSKINPLPDSEIKALLRGKV